MKTLVPLLCLLSALLLAGCATGGFEDKQEFSDAYITKHGFVSVAFWKQADGSIKLRTWADKDTADEFLIEQWNRYALRLGKGARYEGSPKIELYEYTQGYSMLQPYATGEKRTGKRAEGLIRRMPAP